MRTTASVTTALALSTILFATAPLALAADTDLEPLLVEVHPNPEGPDSGREWVEVYNPAPVPLSLDGWSINDPDDCNDGAGYPLDGLSVPAGGNLVVNLTDTCMNLRNTHDAVSLVAPTGHVVQTVGWGSDGELSPPGSGESVAACYSAPGLHANFTLAPPTPGAANAECA